MTYAELDALSDRLAAEILVVTSGRRGAVAFSLPRGVDLLVTLLGILKAGCWYAPIAVGEPRDRVAGMLDVIDPVAVVVGQAPAAAPFDRAPALTVPVAADPDAPIRQLPEVDPEHPVYVLFTSGSTGVPKGVLLGSAALCNRILWKMRHFDLRSGDRVLQKTPYTFDVSGWEFFWPICAGARCVFAPPESHHDPVQVAATIADFGITVCHFVPSMLDEFLRVAALGPKTTLRLVMTSGEALPPALAARFLSVTGVRLHNLYGPTEAAIDVTQWAVPADLTPDDRVFIGAPIDNVDLFVVDNGRPVAEGEPGELWIGGVQVALGYVGQPELTARSFVRAEDGVRYRTGDLVRVVDGQVEYLGRIDDQIKIRGVRIEPGEVEEALRSHPRVVQAAVCAVPARNTGVGHELIAAIVADDPEPTIAELREHVAARLPAALVPSGFRRHHRLPLTSAGKTDRRELYRTLNSWWHSVADVDSPADPLARLWWETLRYPGAQDENAGFLNLGGHSLLAARLNARLRETLGIELPFGALLRDNLSLAGLRSLLADAVPVGEPSPVRDTPSSSSPLAPGQRPLWMLSRLLATPAGYNVVAALRLRGTMRSDTLREALHDVTQRHDALRAQTVLHDGEPFLAYADDVTVPLRVVDAEPGATAESFIDDIAGEIIEADHRPLLRAALWHDGREDVFVLSLHHLIADQQTVDLILADLATAYSARLGGRAPDWPAAPSFADYAHRQAALADGPAWKSDLVYWRGLLDTAPQSTSLPFRLPTPAEPTTTGLRRCHDFGSHASDRIDSFARERGITVATLLLASVALVISGWAGQSSVMLGMPASRRRFADEQDLVGFLLTTLALPLDIGSRPDVGALLKHVADQFTTALDHVLPPFDAVVQALGVPTSPLRNPLFQVWVNDLTRAAPAPAFGDLPAAHIDHQPAAALFDLNFYLRRPGAYRLELVAAAGRHPSSVVSALLAQVSQVLVRLCEVPASTPPSALWPMPAPHPAPAVAGPTPVPLLDRIRGIALHSPDAVAIRAGANELSYTELVAQVDATPAAARAAGVQPGETVQVRAERAAWLPVTILGLWSIGAVPALIDASLPARLLDQARATVGARWLAGQLIEPAAVASAPEIRRGVGHVLFTSGTTGRPAAVAVGNDALATTLAWYQDTFAPSPQDRIAMLAGLGHDPVLRDLFVPLICGGTLIVPPADVLGSPAALLSFLVDSAVTVLHATPALLTLLTAAHSERPELRLPALRLIVCGGAPLTAGLARAVRRLTAAKLVNAYGTTETPQIVACEVVAEFAAQVRPELSDDDSLPVGVGAGAAEVFVVGPGSVPLPVGHLGEVVVRGPNLALGYLGDSGRSERFFTWNGQRAYRTGDRGRIDPAGSLHLSGRIDRELVVRGFRVAPEQIEAAALAHPLVAEARVTQRGTQIGDVLVLAVVAHDPGRPPAAEDLRRHLHELLPPYAVPAELSVVPQLQTLNRKSAPARPSTPRAASGDLAVSAMVRELSALIYELIGRELPPRENFFEHGLDSMSLIRLHARLRERHAGLPVTALFAHPNLEALAQFLTSRETLTTTRDPLRQRSRTDQAPATAAGDAAQRRRQLRRQLIEEFGENP